MTDRCSAEEAELEAQLNARHAEDQAELLQLQVEVAAAPAAAAVVVVVVWTLVLALMQYDVVAFLTNTSDCSCEKPC